MWKLWYLLQKPYPYDHATIDTDYENLVLLTNEHIKNTHPLDEGDQYFYRAYLEEKKKDI